MLQISSYWQPGDDLRLDLLPGEDAEASAARTEAPARSRRTAQRAGRAPAQALGPAPVRTLAAGQAGAPARRARAAPPPQPCATGRWWPAAPRVTRTAEVTLGGVDTDAVSSATMESRRVPGLVFRRRSAGCHRLAGRLQLPMGLGIGPRRRQRGLNSLPPPALPAGQSSTCPWTEAGSIVYYSRSWILGKIAWTLPAGSPDCPALHRVRFLSGNAPPPCQCPTLSPGTPECRTAKTSLSA